MGDISIIARRLEDGHVQYGWSGNGGYFSNVGARLLAWYQSPELVEYLFGLGELEWIGKPGSDKNPESIFYSHKCTGIPHHLGTSEIEIFSKIYFIDYGYFYDIDKQWYYVVPGPFKIKVPLWTIRNNLDDRGYEFDFIDLIRQKLAEYIFNDYGKKDPVFEKIFEERNINKGELKKKILTDSNPMYKLSDYKWLSKYFDDWVVVVPEKDGKRIKEFKVKKKEDKHVETIYW